MARRRYHVPPLTVVHTRCRSRTIFVPSQTVAILSRTHEPRVPLSDHPFAAFSAQLTSETGMRTAYIPDGLSNVRGKGSSWGLLE